MSVVKIIKTMKEVHKDYLMLVKIGVFYHAYGRDAYILNYLFDYQLKPIEKDYVTNGFPEASLNRILATLEREKINYLILDRRNNYEVDQKTNYKKANTYNQKYEKARVYVNLNNRINNIQGFLKENINEKDFKEILLKMEKIIDERRKI